MLTKSLEGSNEDAGDQKDNKKLEQLRSNKNWLFSRWKCLK